MNTIYGIIEPIFIFLSMVVKPFFKDFLAPFIIWKLGASSLAAGLKCGGRLRSDGMISR